MDSLNLFKEISNLFLKLNVKDIVIDFKRTGSFVLRGYLNDSQKVNPYIEFRYDKNTESIYVRINKGGKDIHAIFTTTVSLKGLNLKSFLDSFSVHVINTLNNLNINLILESNNSKMFTEKVLKTSYLYFSSDNYINGFEIKSSSDYKELSVKLKHIRNNNVFKYRFTGDDLNNIYIKYANADNYANGDKVEFGNELKKFIDTYGKTSSNFKNKKLDESEKISRDIWTHKKIGNYENLKGHLKFSDESIEYSLDIEQPNIYYITTNEGYVICLLKLKKHVLYLDNYSVSPVILLKDNFLRGVNLDNPILIWDKILIESVKTENTNILVVSEYQNRNVLKSEFSKHVEVSEIDFIFYNDFSWEFDEE